MPVTTSEIKTRYIVKNDMRRIAEIDKQEQKEIESLFKGQDVVNGMVAVNDTDDVIGFCIYNLESEETFAIMHLATDQDFYRRGIATTLITRMKSKLNKRRNVIEYEIPEDYLPMQIFLKKAGFKAKLKRGVIDTYLFTYTENI